MHTGPMVYIPLGLGPALDGLATDPTEHGADPGGQLAGAGRLGHVVGGARLQGQDGVELVVLLRSP